MVSYGICELVVSLFNDFGNQNSVSTETSYKSLRQLKEGSAVYLDEAGMDDTDDYGYGWCLRGERFYAKRKASRKGRVILSLSMATSV